MNIRFKVNGLICSWILLYGKINIHNQTKPKINDGNTQIAILKKQSMWALKMNILTVYEKLFCIIRLSKLY